MINQLELHNYQSHKETLLEFTEGVNVIIGSSDSGKTSIIRALRWIAWNRPLGDAFRSNWGGDTLAKITFDDGYSVERLEADNDRHYKIDKSTKDFKEDFIFQAFGTEVPEEVSEVLNFDEINLQEQMDAPFLISDNPGKVSRYFNKVANIDKIDSSLRAVESWIRSINSDIKAAEEEIERHKRSLEEFNYLDKMEADVEVLESLEERKNNKAGGATKLSTLIGDIEILSTKIQKASKLLPAEQPVTEILGLMESREDVIAGFKTLRELCAKISNVDSKLAEASKLIDAENTVDSLLDLYNKKQQQKQEFTELKNLIFSIVDKQDDIEESKQHLVELEDTWHEVAPETCPLCEGTGKLKTE